jgi:hypothetical protein
MARASGGQSNLRPSSRGIREKRPARPENCKTKPAGVEDATVVSAISASVLSAGTRRVVTSVEAREFVTADKGAAYVCARPCESAYPARVSFMETTTATRRIARARPCVCVCVCARARCFRFFFRPAPLFLPFSFSNEEFDIAPADKRGGGGGRRAPSRFFQRPARMMGGEGERAAPCVQQARMNELC